MSNGTDKDAVETLIDKAAKAGMPDEAMKYSQAATNVANARAQVAATARLDKVSN